MGGMKLNSDEKACENGISVPEIDYKELKFYERLSSGSFGTVYRAEWSKTGKIVAVKRVLVLEKEAHVLNLIRHKNIIQFFGAVTEPPNFCIVLEYASKGSLFSLLHKEDNDSDSNLPFEVLMRWATDIANGVNYLHNEAPCKIIHRDLKSGNVVIDESNTCKLCDFGTSKPLSHTTKMTTVGTVAWMSPEMIQSLPVGEPTDTWSFGVVLWELLTRQVPFKGFESFRVAWMVVEENERLCIPSGCPQNLKIFLQKCWDKNPKARPLFPEILATLQNIVNDAQISADTVNFLTQKNRWIDEIEQHICTLQSKEKELTERETKLLDWEKRLARREQNIENSRKSNMVQNGNRNVDMWDENDVADWYKGWMNKADHQMTSVPSLLFNRLRDNGINGHRLRLITDNDLRHMGIGNAMFRNRFLDEIRHLWTEIDNHSNEECPLYDSTLKYNGDSNTYELNLTLLTGFYVREGISLETHKWKPFLDIDDVDQFENGARLIQKVTLCLDENPLDNIELDKPPFVSNRWLKGLRNGITVKFDIDFNGSLIEEPLAVSFTMEINDENRSRLTEHLVVLKVIIVQGNVDSRSFGFRGQPSLHDFFDRNDFAKLPRRFGDDIPAFPTESRNKTRCGSDDASSQRDHRLESVLRKSSDNTLLTAVRNEVKQQQQQQTVGGSSAATFRTSQRTKSDDSSKFFAEIQRPSELKFQELRRDSVTNFNSAINMHNVSSPTRISAENVPLRKGRPRGAEREDSPLRSLVTQKSCHQAKNQSPISTEATRNTMLNEFSMLGAIGHRSPLFDHSKTTEDLDANDDQSSKDGDFAATAAVDRRRRLLNKDFPFNAVTDSSKGFGDMMKKLDYSSTAINSRTFFQ